VGWLTRTLFFVTSLFAFALRSTLVNATRHFDILVHPRRPRGGKYLARLIGSDDAPRSNRPLLSHADKQT